MPAEQDVDARIHIVSVAMAAKRGFAPCEGWNSLVYKLLSVAEIEFIAKYGGNNIADLVRCVRYGPHKAAEQFVWDALPEDVGLVTRLIN